MGADGAQVNATDAEQHTPLVVAAEEGHEAVVAVLLHANADVDTQGWVALQLAQSRGHSGVATLLMTEQWRRRFSDTPTLALFVGAASGQLSEVQTALAQGADFNACDGMMRTALAVASQ